MNWEDVQQALNKLDEIDPKIIEDAEVAKDLDKFRHKFLRKAKKRSQTRRVWKPWLNLLK